MSTVLSEVEEEKWQVVLADQVHPENNTRLTALCLVLIGWAGTRKVKPVWILLKQETVCGKGTMWSIYKLDLYRPDAVPAAQPTAL